MIIYKIVDRTHPITDIKCPPELDFRIQKWWKSMKLFDCNQALLAFDKRGRKEILIGFVRFIKNDKDFLADGTYVLPAYRRQKIAKKLWARALKYAKPNYIEVYTATKGGAGLIASLVKKYTKIDWHIFRTSRR